MRFLFGLAAIAAGLLLIVAGMLKASRSRA
jgi:hypothetical protein